MNIVNLLSEQKSGIFFVWKTEFKELVITFLRSREGVSTQSQINKAVHDGRARALELVGVGHYWRIKPIMLREITEKNVLPIKKQDADVANDITASLLTLKQLPERERKSTEHGAQEMREKYIPIVRERMREILLGRISKN